MTTRCLCQNWSYNQISGANPVCPIHGILPKKPSQVILSREDAEIIFWAIKHYAKPGIHETHRAVEALDILEAAMKGAE